MTQTVDEWMNELSRYERIQSEAQIRQTWNAALRAAQPAATVETLERVVKYADELMEALMLTRVARERGWGEWRATENLSHAEQRLGLVLAELRAKEGSDE